jgi:hypothetical protein
MRSRINIPQEHALIYNNNTKDKHANKRVEPNKYWFQYPPEWTTANVGEKIIGIRSLTINHVTRNIWFIVTISLPNEQTPETPEQGSVPPTEPDDAAPTPDSGDESVQAKLGNFYVKFTLTDDWKELDDRVQQAVIAQLGKGEKYRNLVNVELTRLSRNKEFKDATMIRRTEKYWSYYNIDDLVENDELDSYGIRFTIDSITFPGATLMVEPASYDTRFVLHAEDFTADDSFNDPKHNINCVEFYDVWDRRSCEIKSSIANGVQNNYLGHTNVRYDPVKYFRINNNETGFTVELSSANDSIFPVVLPFDDRESINLEFVILQNATELYT